MQPHPHLNTQGLHRVPNSHGAPDRPLRTVKHRQEPIARSIHLASPKPTQLRSDNGVVCVEQCVPVAVAHLGSALCGVHDVGEQHRGENPIIGHLGLLSGEELGDFPEGLAPTVACVLGLGSGCGIARFGSDGALDEVIDLPGRFVSSLAFAGTGVYVTTIGALLRIDVGVRGSVIPAATL